MTEAFYASRTKRVSVQSSYGTKRLPLAPCYEEGNGAGAPTTVRTVFAQLSLSVVLNPELRKTAQNYAELLELLELRITVGTALELRKTAQNCTVKFCGVFTAVNSGVVLALL